MKNLLKTITLFIAAGMLLASCRASLTKRHYRNGYHFNMAKKAEAPKEKNAETERKTGVTSVSEQITQAAAEEIVFANAGNKNEITQSNINGGNSVKSGQINNYSAVEGETPGSSAISVEKTASVSFTENKIENKRSLRASSDDGLSLLWIVIVVLLILWLIGYLGGGWIFGGFIHLLLVIALILLILWLLRIL
jgi:hypothetical protein